VPDDVAAAWFVQVDVAPDEVDTASGVLWGAGVTGIEEIDLDDGRRRLLAGCDEDGAATVVEALGGRWAVASYAAAYDGWLDAWRPFAQTVRVGRFVVHPAWEEPDVGPGDVTVAIDAERAFGQGNHPTTRLVVGALDALIEPGHSVLDVGCGSGVLSVVAARTGASRVVAVDIEEAAVAATSANAERNGVGATVEASATPVQEVTGAFDVVVANILAPVLVELAPAVAARVAPGKTLVLSGLLSSQRDEVLAAYPGFVVEAETEIDGWLCCTIVAAVRTV
jgi:ribosomal protein L11 methyltransferase